MYDRAQLYEEVWDEAMQVVAKRYGVSGVALAKTCRRMGVPVPGRGYWAKLRAGREVEPRPPLPPLEPGQPQQAFVQRVQQPARPQWAEEVAQAVSLDTAEPVVVAATLEDPHKLVVLASRYLAKAHVSGGLLCVSHKSCLDIRVSPQSLDRALRIFDSLIKAAERAGLKVEVAVVDKPEPANPYGYRFAERVPEPPARVTRAICDGEIIEFRLTEEVRRVEVPQPQGPAKKRLGYQPLVCGDQPTGELLLQLLNTSGLGVRSKWQDGKQQRVENCLAEFIANLSRASLAFKLKRQAEEERAQAAREAERRRWEEEKRRNEEEERQRQEKRRRDEFEAEVARWRRARDIRDYVQAALEALGEEDPSCASDKAQRERLRWALEYSDKLDPLQ